MLMWLYELVPPSDLVRHISLFLLVVAMAMPTVALLRTVALASGVVAIVSAAFVTYDPIWLFWEVLFVLVILVRIVLGTSRRFGRALKKDDEFFHREVVPDLTSAQVRKLLTAGRWRDVLAGTVLTRQGEPIEEMSFVGRGTVDIIVDGQRVAECGPGALIGEIGLSTGDPATATAVARGPVRYLGLNTTRLYHLLDAHVDLQDAVELAIQRSLREKLLRSNVRVAHPGDGGE